MPRSTSSAVRTPSRERPSSTSVIATAGCMPTTTVVAITLVELGLSLAGVRTALNVEYGMELLARTRKESALAR